MFLTEIITKSETEGLGIKQVADEIQKKFNKIKGYEARRIATTEINSANNYVTYQELVNDEVVNYKQWITCEDNRVRPTHIELNGQITRIGDKFSNGLEYPGDHNGKASEVINCRCTLIPYFLDWDKIPPNTTTFYEKDLKSMEDQYTQEKDKLITEQINIINANQNLAKPTEISVNEEEAEYKKLVEQLDKANIKYKINDDGKLEFENKIDEVLVTAHQKELLQKYYGKIKITQKKPKKKKEEDEDTKIEKLIQRGKQLKQKLKRKKKKTKAQQHTEQIKKRYPDYEPPEYFEEKDPFTIINADKKYVMSLMENLEELSEKAGEYYKLKYKRGANREDAKKAIWDWSGDAYDAVRDYELNLLDPNTMTGLNDIEKAEEVLNGLKSFDNKLEHDTVLLRGAKGTYNYDMRIGAINKITTTSSTSLSKDIAHEFTNITEGPIDERGFIWIILAPKKTPMVPVTKHSQFKREAEILLHKDQEFQILTVNENKTAGIVKLINSEEDKLTTAQINNIYK